MNELPNPQVIDSEIVNSDLGNTAVQVITQRKETLIAFIESYFTWHTFFNILGAVFVILVIFSVYKIAINTVKKVPEEKLSEQKSLAIQKTVQVIFYILVLMYILSLFGVKLSAIWGAAGIAGVALAFAAQTSVSNIISGLFIIAEKEMKVGDLITVGTETGIVDAIGLLSVQVHTFDNQLIRIPNSTIIDSNMINTTYFTKRRMSFAVTVSYDCDIEKVLSVLSEVPANCKYALKNPAPFAFIDKLSSTGIDLILNVWFKNEDFISIKNEVFLAIKKSFDKENIKIPFTVLKVDFTEEEKFPTKKSILKISKPAKGKNNLEKKSSARKTVTKKS